MQKIGINHKDNYYIEFLVNFDDDEYVEMYGGAAYKVHGWRYTGFENDD